MYRRLTEGLSDRGILIPCEDHISNYIKDTDKDWYISTYQYTEEQRNLFFDSGTIAGITDVVTNRLWWDFDSEVEVEEARISTLTLVKRLMDKGIEKEDIIIAFSGNKGFGVELNITQTLTPKAVKAIAFDLAKDLANFDVKMYNASRILRIRNTRHQKTKLFKIPLTLDMLDGCSADAIQDLAKVKGVDTPEYRWKPITLPPSIYKEQLPDNVASVAEPITPSKYVDYSMKPKFLSNCRFAIQQGFFSAGERNHALLCLGSSYKNLGFDLEHTYRLLKAVAHVQSKKSNTPKFSSEEIYTNIINQVYGPNWKNGQYTCKEKNNWLQTFCEKLDSPCNHREDDEFKPKGFLDIKSSFKDYVHHIEANTVLTGIDSIDKHVFISTGANVGIIGAPGSGKSSLALNLLNKTSMAGVKSVFASLDMHRNRMFEKVLYKISGKPREEIYDIFRNNQEAALMEQLNHEFGNVFFFNKSSPTVEDVRNYVIACQDRSGEKIKFVMLDYFERISSDLGDDTAASKRVAGELQDMVNDLDVALVNLVQPHKAALSGGPDSPIYDYTKIKGSSYVYQSMRIIMSLWRPFYSPKTFEDDRFMQMAVLKNDLGELCEFTFKWNGPKGEISEMGEFDHEEYQELLRKKQALAGGGDGDDFKAKLWR